MINGNTHVHYADVTLDLVGLNSELHHSNTFVLCERARGAALEALGYSVHELWRDGYSLSVRDLSSDHPRPVLAGDKLAILSELSIDSERLVSVEQRIALRRDLPALDLDGSFVNGAGLVAPTAILRSVQTRLVCVNLGERRTVAPPARLADALGRVTRRESARPSGIRFTLLAEAS